KYLSIIGAYLDPKKYRCRHYHQEYTDDIESGCQSAGTGHHQLIVECNRSGKGGRGALYQFVSHRDQGPYPIEDPGQWGRDVSGNPRTDLYAILYDQKDRYRCWSDPQQADHVNAWRQYLCGQCGGRRQYLYLAILKQFVFLCRNAVLLRLYLSFFGFQQQAWYAFPLCVCLDGKGNL